MRLTRLALPVLCVSLFSSAQVLTPDEIRDPQLSELQTKYFGQLKQIAIAMANRDRPYPFYFSRKLDLSEKEQRASDQRAIQFDHYHGQTVLKITGNYFASYSADLMPPAERARQTFQDVILPLLETAVPLFAQADIPDAFAFEVSHHVRKKMLGVAAEGFENVVLILPKASAMRYMTSSNQQFKQAALAEGQAFLNAEPIELWPGGKAEVTKALPAPEPAQPSTATSKIRAETHPIPSTPAHAPVRDTSPEALKNLQKSYQSNLDRMVQEIDAQAHFVRYAPPAFIPFHNGLYLQVSVATALPESAAGSQYKLAALAFDQHIVHLIRPALEYFKEERGDFDGIDFSTTLRLGTGSNAEGSPLAVEFIFPLEMLRQYKAFDATGQQLIDAGFVLINGERVSLDLQIAEATAR